ncbi:hypothetical protein ACHAWC_005699, partial [Mediolabrus comicus]
MSLELTLGLVALLRVFTCVFYRCQTITYNFFLTNPINLPSCYYLLIAEARYW